MKVKSLTRNGYEFQIIEVELTLLRGLPTVRVLGLPDAVIKESVNRLKAALLGQDFIWPRAKQMLFNLRPSHERKSSNGLDLALAAALLIKTGQMEVGSKADLIYYGELSVDGAVHAPRDLMFLPSELQSQVVSGQSQEWSRPQGWEVSTLKELAQPRKVVAQSEKLNWNRPPLTSREFTPVAAKLLEIVAAGEHPLMIGGPAGTGKSTFVESLFELLTEPVECEFNEAKRWALQKGENPEWRPFVSPHHSTPALSMLGGGVPPVPGEVTRAHSGMLFLDEYLEFDPKIQQALREPMEKGDIRISRRGESRIYPARFLTVAATNLCPCGRYYPKMPSGCDRTIHTCHAHLRRLSGPVLDRFDVFAYSHLWKGQRAIGVERIKENVDRAVEFRRSRGQTLPNGRLSLKELHGLVDEFALSAYLPTGDVSERRKRSLLRLARTIADLKGETDILPMHLSEARQYGLVPFLDILPT